MHQTRGLLSAGMQEAINRNGRSFIWVGEAVGAAVTQAFVTARDEMVHAEMFQLQRGRRRASAISRVAASVFLRLRWPVVLSIRALLFIRKLLRVFVHQVHGSQGLELRAGNGTGAVDPFGVYISR